MTNTNSDPSTPGKQEPYVLIPVSVLEYVRSRKLSGSQYDLWLYLFSLDPFGDRWVDIPSPLEISLEIGFDPRTIQRNANKLADCDLFDFEIKAWKARNTTVRAKPTKAVNFSSGKEIHLPTNRSICGQFDPSADNVIHRSNDGQIDPKTETLEVNQDNGSRDSVKNGDVPNKEQTCSTKQTTGASTPPTHPVEADSLRSVDSGVLGTSPTRSDPYSEDVAALLQLVREANVNPTKTVEQTILKRLQDDGAAVGAKTVENSISSLKEARAKGMVQNPGGFLVAAIRKGFTANGAKKAARSRRYEQSSGKPTQAPIPESLPGQPPTPIADLSGVLASIDCELMRLDWSKDEAIAHMVEQQRWRKIAFSKIPDADLVDLLTELRRVEL